MHTDLIAGGLPCTDIEEGYPPLTDPSLFRRAKPRSPISIPLSEELVRLAQSPKGSKEAWIQDAQHSSLHLRIRASGAKSYYHVQRRQKVMYPGEVGEDARREYLGSAAELSINDARRRADSRIRGIELALPHKRLRRDTRAREAVRLYKEEFPSCHSQWNTTKNRLLDTKFEPICGDRFLPGIKRAEYDVLIEEALSVCPSRGIHLLKALKAFLYWAAAAGLLQANPLAKVRIELPHRWRPRLLKAQLITIIDAATKVGAPWDAIFTLAIFTGATFEDVRRIQGADIDWIRSAWHVRPRGRRPPKLGCCIPLVPECLASLTRYRTTQGYLFASAKLLDPTPINVYPEVISRITTTSNIGKWELFDIWRSVKSSLGPKPFPQDWDRWGASLRETRAELQQEQEGVAI
jgi:integrase